MSKRGFAPVEIDIRNALAYLDAMKEQGHYWPHADAQLRALLSQPAPSVSRETMGQIIALYADPDIFVDAIQVWDYFADLFAAEGIAVAGEEPKE